MYIQQWRTRELVAWPYKASTMRDRTRSERTACMDCVLSVKAVFVRKSAITKKKNRGTSRPPRGHTNMFPGKSKRRLAICQLRPARQGVLPKQRLSKHKNHFCLQTDKPNCTWLTITITFAWKIARMKERGNHSWLSARYHMRELTARPFELGRVSAQGRGICRTTFRGSIRAVRICLR